MPVERRPPWVVTSQPESVVTPSGQRRASTESTTHCAPKRSAASRSSSGRAMAAVLTPTLSAPARSSRSMSSTVRTPPPTVRGMNTCSAVRRTTSYVVVAVAAARGDVEEDELVGALGVVRPGELDGVAGIAEVDEVDALDDAARVDVEARDDTDGDGHAGEPTEAGAVGTVRSATRTRVGQDQPRRRGEEQTVGETLGLALAIAASPFPVIPSILLLFTGRPRAAASAFLAGWAGGILMITTVLVVLSEFVESSQQSPTWVSWVRVALGAALLGYGVRQWLGRRAADTSPAWMRSIGNATPAMAFRLALLLSAANPKVVLIAAAAGLSIGSGELHGWAEVGAVLAFTAVASVSVSVPLLSYVMLGDRVLGPLGVARDWLTRHNAAVLSVVLVVLGILLLLKGIQGL